MRVLDKKQDSNIFNITSIENFDESEPQDPFLDTITVNVIVDYKEYGHYNVSLDTVIGDFIVKLFRMRFSAEDVLPQQLEGCFSPFDVFSSLLCGFAGTLRKNYGCTPLRLCNVGILDTNHFVTMQTQNNLLEESLDPSCLTLGKDVDLNSPFSNYVKPGNSVYVFINKLTQNTPVVHKIEYALSAFERKQSFPPALNFYEEDPINLKTIGLGENNPNNMIIIQYPNGVKRAYNKQKLLDCIVEDPEHREPITRIICNSEFIHKISTSLGNFEVIPMYCKEVITMVNKDSLNDSNISKNARQIEFADFIGDDRYIKALDVESPNTKNYNEDDIKNMLLEDNE